MWLKTNRSRYDRLWLEEFTSRWSWNLTLIKLSCIELSNCRCRVVGVVKQKNVACPALEIKFRARNTTFHAPYIPEDLHPLLPHVPEMTAHQPGTPVRTCVTFFQTFTVTFIVLSVSLYHNQIWPLIRFWAEYYRKCWWEMALTIWI